jgi:hypothetical protein
MTPLGVYLQLNLLQFHGYSQHLKKQMADLLPINLKGLKAVLQSQKTLKMHPHLNMLNEDLV